MKVVSGLKILYICQSVTWRARRLEMKFMEIVEASSASFSPFNTLVFTENKKNWEKTDAPFCFRELLFCNSG